MQTNDQKLTNILITILISPVLILKYAYIGLKSLFVIKKKKKIYKYSNSKLKALGKEKELLLKDLIEAGATRNNKYIIYKYTAKNSEGKIINGIMNALSKLDVNSFLTNEGYEVYSIKNGPMINFLYQESTLFGQNKLTTKELIVFLEQLATYLKAGITISESVKILSKQITKNKTKIRKLNAISYELTLGETFSGALEKQKDFFPSLIVNMVKSAELSGSLNETLDKLSEYYAGMHSSKKDMISAITYPSIVLSFSIIVIIFMMIFIVPNFSQIYINNGSEVTGITKIVLDFSEYIQKNIFYIIFGTFFAILLFIFLYKKSKEFKSIIQKILLRIPLLKNIIIYNELSIMSSTFETLLKNGVYITDCIAMLKNITNNEVYKEILTKANINIENGRKFSDAFKNHYAVPDAIYYMLSTGEDTGDMSVMMGNINEYTSVTYKGYISTLKATVEPLLTVFLALIVGIIIISVIVPMYEVYNEIGLG